MPTISVFFRNEDLRIWQNIHFKSEWLHQHLAGDCTAVAPDVDALVTEAVAKAEQQLQEPTYTPPEGTA